jgi:acetyl esterase/lipase
VWRIPDTRRTLAGKLLALLLCAPVVALAGAPAPAANPAISSQLDIPFAQVGGQTLLLDLHMPTGVSNPPLVVYLHGGAWSEGDKQESPPILVEHGYAVAALNFRSSEEARFPANVHDIKAGIRFLRANAAKYGYRADRIAVSGSSSGGHLAALVGVTNGHQELEGTVGTHLRESSDVQAIVAWVGAYNLETVIPQSTAEGQKSRIPAVQMLLGGLPEEVPELARLASPVAHVDRNDPPLIILHGDQDLRIPVNQALELDGAYRRAGLVAELVIVPGVGHVARPFFGPGEPADRVFAFLRRTIGR